MQIVIEGPAVTVSGSAEELRTLAGWLLKAAVIGEADFTVIYKDGETIGHIRREDDG